MNGTLTGAIEAIVPALAGIESALRMIATAILTHAGVYALLNMGRK